MTQQQQQHQQQGVQWIFQTANWYLAHRRGKVHIKQMTLTWIIRSSSTGSFNFPTLANNDHKKFSFSFSFFPPPLTAALCGPPSTRPCLWEFFGLNSHLDQRDHLWANFPRVRAATPMFKATPEPEDGDSASSCLRQPVLSKTNDR